MSLHRIAVAARKGGVGKTTIACGIASVLASQSRKVLVIDLDPQSNSAYILGADPTKPGSSALLLGEAPSPLSINSNLAVLPGGPELMSHAIQKLYPEELLDAISQLNLNYDVIVFDCPPGNEYLERFALVASSLTLVVADAHPLAVIGAGRVITELKTNFNRGRKGASRWAIVQSRIDLRRSLDRDLDKQLAHTYPGVERLVVHQDTQLSLAAADRIPIMDYAPDCRGVKDLLKVAKWGING